MNQLDPKAVWMFFFTNFFWSFFIFIGLGFPLIIGITSAETIATGITNVVHISLWILFGEIAYTIVCFFGAKLHYRMYKYKLGEDAFQKELGIINEKYITIPYNRIQNVDIHRGITARILGLSSVNIQTARASGAQKGYGGEGQLIGVSQGDAELVRDELLGRISPSKDQGL